MIKLINKLLDPLRNVKSDLIIKEGGHSYLRMTNSFESALKPAVVVPFHGVDQIVILRKLTGTQRRACGDFSLIETVFDKMARNDKNISFKEQCEYSKTQHEILKKSLVSPTYEEIMALNEYDILRKAAEKELLELEPEINGMPNGTKKEKLKNDYYLLEMNSKYLLPSDFISFVLSYALNIDDSDLSDVTADMLFEASMHAKRSGGRPSTYMPGNFKDHHLVDIDNRAWSEYARREQKKNGGR